MSCSSILTSTLSVTGLLLSLSSIYVTTILSSDKTTVPPCDLSPTLSCSSLLSSPYSTGLGLVTPLLGKDHPANLPNSVFSSIIFAIIFLANFFSNNLMNTLMLILSTIFLITKSTITIISLPVMCPISLASLVTTFLMVLAIVGKKKSLDNSGYSFPRPTNNNSQAFKKFI